MIKFFIYIDLVKVFKNLKDFNVERLKKVRRVGK